MFSGKKNFHFIFGKITFGKINNLFGINFIFSLLSFASRTVLNMF